MKIWILLDRSDKKFHKYENTELLANIPNAELVAASDLEIIVNSQSDKSIIYHKKKVPLPDVVIPRSGSRTSYFTRAVLRHLQNEGVWVLNSALSISRAKDKLQTLQALAAQKLPIPKTMIGRFPTDLDDIERELSYPFVLKKVSGSSGKGVLLIKDRQNFEDIMGLVQEENSSMNLIFQEFVKASKAKDLRVIVIGGRTIGAMMRRGKPGDFRSNYSAGGSAESFELTPEIEWLAVEAAKVLELEIAGVDILFGEEGQYFICEVNANPGFQGFQSANEINVSQEIYNFVNLKLGQL